MEITQAAIAARHYREHLLKDDYRPVYHFAVPEGLGFPGDTNGAFFADGVYHVMYLYRNCDTNAYHWYHVTSTDLLHWRYHADALGTHEGDEGCYSGGAFVDEDGTAYLSFWKFPAKKEGGDKGGVALARADAPYEVWERIEPIAIEGTEWGVKELTVNGQPTLVGCADPSNIWKMGEWYYLQTGNLCILLKDQREGENNPHHQGDWTDLFRSKDLKTWEYVHRFYENPHTDNTWPDKTEDDMCPSFLPLFDAKQKGAPTNKWLQLFIAHNRGCQYYIGELQGETFVPEQHGRMSWNDNAFFAPEALIDDQNRHIVFTWLRDCVIDDFGWTDYNRFGWTGSFALPRTVWLQDGGLRIAPVDEIDRLQYNHQTPTIADDGQIPVKNGEVFRLKATFDLTKNDKAGVRVRADEHGFVDIYYDKAQKRLVFDTTHPIAEKGSQTEEAPLCLGEDELLSLDIFVDKSIIEVFANEKQAICRHVYPAHPTTATAVAVIGQMQTLDVWDMAPTNPY